MPPRGEEKRARAVRDEIYGRGGQVRSWLVSDPDGRVWDARRGGVPRYVTRTYANKRKFDEEFNPGPASVSSTRVSRPEKSARSLVRSAPKLSRALVSNRARVISTRMIKNNARLRHVLLRANVNIAQRRRQSRAPLVSRRKGKRVCLFAPAKALCLGNGKQYTVRSRVLFTREACRKNAQLICLRRYSIHVRMYL